MSPKRARAKRMSGIGRHHASFNAMFDSIPPSVVESLSSARLAELVDAMWRLAQHSKALAAREACEEGAVWDANKGKMRELSE